MEEEKNFDVADSNKNDYCKMQITLKENFSSDYIPYFLFLQQNQSKTNVQRKYI